MQKHAQREQRMKKKGVSIGKNLSHDKPSVGHLRNAVKTRKESRVFTILWNEMSEVLRVA